MAFWSNKYYEQDTDRAGSEEKRFTGLGLRRLVSQSSRTEDETVSDEIRDIESLLEYKPGRGSSRVINGQSRSEKKKSASGKSFDHYRSAINAGETLEGQVHFAQPVRIEGHIVGSVFSSESLVIGPDAHIEGKIQAKVLVIQGRVEGDVDACTSVYLYSGGVLNGSVDSPRFIMDEGCTFNGNCRMQSNGKVVMFPIPAAS